MPTLTKRKVGRPKTGRKPHRIRFTQAEVDRLDLLRRGKARGVWLGKLIMEQPLNPFDRFKLLRPKG